MIGRGCPTLEQLWLPMRADRASNDHRSGCENGVLGVFMVFLGRWKIFLLGVPGKSLVLDGQFKKLPGVEIKPQIPR